MLIRDTLIAECLNQVHRILPCSLFPTPYSLLPTPYSLKPNRKLG
ncbi:hypothetical protein [Moorena sp. SIOASIH]|nr:hypothetical protein [Moorena sp. SIOASIH]